MTANEPDETVNGGANSTVRTEMTASTGRGQFAALGILAVGTVALYLPMLLRLYRQHDYEAHIRSASQLADGVLTTPHMLFHGLTVVLGWLAGGNLEVAALIVILLCVLATAAILYQRVLHEAPVSPATRALWALSLLLVAPLTLFFPVDGHLYFGYVGINLFHNPTMLALKPFALLTFMLSAWVVCRQRGTGRAWLFLTLPLLVACSALAKPSFLVCFLPALSLMVAVRTLSRAHVDWPLFVWGIFLPAVVVLGGQYYLTYSATQMAGFYEGDSGIVLAPLQVKGLYSQWLAPKFLLSAAFPLLVAGFYARTVVRDNVLILAWLTFAVGSFQAYFLAESGPRFSHGNFWWGAQIGLFILFASSVAHLLGARRQGKRGDWKFYLCLGVFVLHLLFGGFYYAMEIWQPVRFW